MVRHKTKPDLRDVASYGVSEAAQYLGIAEATLWSWVKGRKYATAAGSQTSAPLIKLADSRHEALSFFNLIEAHVLLFTRQVHGIQMPAVRNAIAYVRDYMDIKRPLINQTFYTDGKDLFIKKLEENMVINASKLGQLGMGQILDLYLKRIDWDTEGLAARLYPVRINSQGDTRTIVIDPHISLGRPIISGTGITASALWHRKKHGEDIEDISRDYGLEKLAVEEAIGYYKAA